MKIKITSEYSNETTEEDLQWLVSRKVDGADYDRGQLEELSATLRNQTALLAKVIEKLKLSDEELTEMLGTWGEKLSKL